MDLVDTDHRAAIEYLLNWQKKTNEISSVIGGSVEGYAGPFRGKKKKKKTT